MRENLDEVIRERLVKLMFDEDRTRLSGGGDVQADE